MLLLILFYFNDILATEYFGPLDRRPLAYTIFKKTSEMGKTKR